MESPSLSPGRAYSPVRNTLIATSGEPSDFLVSVCWLAVQIALFGALTPGTQPRMHRLIPVHRLFLHLNWEERGVKSQLVRASNNGLNADMRFACQVEHESR